MATATSSVAAAPAVSDQALQPVSASPALASHQQHPTTNGTFVPVTDGVIHPGLRLDMRNANGAQRDGRVRNPIPSKLKGKTDERKGNFNVMHMDISNPGESQARYDAAKRSSESTALQAKLAETDHYVSHHRRANYARTKSAEEKEATAPPPALPARNRILTAEEVKAEQARLLTLLRTLPHANIVDQICKALAFFGGIPDAPPPADGKFPDSGEANGPGSLFVGWLSEIFPDLERPRRPVVQLSAPPKRPRGRPKGSKATKARRDKGLKKGMKAADGTTQPDDQQDGEDEGWEDMNDSLMDTNRPDESVEDRVLSLLRTPPQNATATQATPATGGSSGFTSINTSAPDIASASASKKRGRPKGSRNRPKEPDAQDVSQQGQMAPAAAPAAAVAFLPAATANPATEATGTPKKTVAGRTKGGKKKAANTSVQQTPASQIGTSTTYIPPPALPLAATRPAITPSAPTTTNESNSKVKRTQLPSQTQVPNLAQGALPTQATPQVKESTITGAKRKRQSAKSDGKLASVDVMPDPTGANSSHAQAGLSMASAHGSGNVIEPQLQANSTPLIDSTTAPPSKRARKSNPAASKRKSTAAATADASPATPILDSASGQQPSHAKSTSVQSHQPAEGLEAHYERFTSLQNSNDQNQTYGNQQQQVSTTSVNTSSAPAEGLAAHYERFAALQNRQDNVNNRQQTRQVQQQQQQATQSVSPAPPQVSKTPQVATLPSQQQSRPATNTPNYYAQSQTPAFTVQQGSYTNQRQTQNPSTSSPGTALVSQVSHSPQYATQSNNSPLLSNDTTFRGSPSLGFAPRRTLSASPMDNTYRTNSVTNQPFANTRQTGTNSHSGVASGFPSFTDNNFLDLQGFDSTNGNNMGLGGNGSYTMASGNVQRTNSGSNTGAAYGNPAMTNGTYDQSGLNKGSMNTGYRGQARWS